MKNYSLSTQLLKELIKQENLDPQEKTSLKLALGRVYLQCGDIVSAENYFNQVFKSGGKKSLSEYISRGLLHVAKAEFPEALKFFTEGLKIDPKNIMVIFYTNFLGSYLEKSYFSCTTTWLSVTYTRES